LASSCRGESKRQPATHVRRAAGPTRMHAWLGAASLDRGSEPPGGRPGRSMEQGRSRKPAWERSSRTRPREAGSRTRPSARGGPGGPGASRLRPSSRPGARRPGAAQVEAGAGRPSRKSAQLRRRRCLFFFSSYMLRRSIFSCSAKCGALVNSRTLPYRGSSPRQISTSN
jgi:hypothetical protein